MTYIETILHLMEQGLDYPEAFDEMLRGHSGLYRLHPDYEKPANGGE